MHLKVYTLHLIKLKTHFGPHRYTLAVALFILTIGQLAANYP